MRSFKFVIAAVLTLASSAAFAATKHDRAPVAVERGAAQPIAMQRELVQPRRGTITGRPASAPTIFGHAPLSLTYGLPHQNGS